VVYARLIPDAIVSLCVLLHLGTALIDARAEWWYNLLCERR